MRFRHLGLLARDAPRSLGAPFQLQPKQRHFLGDRAGGLLESGDLDAQLDADHQQNEEGQDEHEVDGRRDTGEGGEPSRDGRDERQHDHADDDREPQNAVLLPQPLRAQQPEQRQKQQRRDDQGERVAALRQEVHAPSSS
jgi:hypothetical protein